ncbi:hypothetical protein LY76DRAFT_157699 [Colletotrichum caudatum]|nr:hypothetical protein LY76DRAFT_157699 [Colletotrichum caudatum]
MYPSTLRPPKGLPIKVLGMYSRHHQIPTDLPCPGLGFATGRGRGTGESRYVPPFSFLFSFPLPLVGGIQVFVPTSALSPADLYGS